MLFYFGPFYAKKVNYFSHLTLGALQYALYFIVISWIVSTENRFIKKTLTGIVTKNMLKMLPN